MVLNNSANILAIVSGPAPSSTWETFANSPDDLAKGNGLWQSILKVADYVLVDSTTSDNYFFIILDLICMKIKLQYLSYIVMLNLCFLNKIQIPLSTKYFLGKRN